MEELVHDRYRTVSEVPPIVSAYGYIPKKARSEYLLIQDCNELPEMTDDVCPWQHGVNIVILIQFPEGQVGNMIDSPGYDTAKNVVHIL